MNVRNIVSEWLRKHGYDGLYTEDCGCVLDDLMPCSGPYEFSTSCNPGYRNPCPGADECYLDGDCEFHVGPNRWGIKDETRPIRRHTCKVTRSCWA